MLDQLHQWLLVDQKAVPAEVSRADGEPMGIAGLWSSWRSPSGWVESYTMLTVKADNYPIFKQLHKPQDEKRIKRFSYTINVVLKTR